MSHCAIKIAALALAAALAGIPAGAQDLDPGSHQTGPAECAKLLWVGGYRASGTSGDCTQSSGSTSRGSHHGYTHRSDKDDQARRQQDFELFRQKRLAKEQAAKDRRKAEQDRRDAEKKKRDQDEKAKRDQQERDRRAREDARRRQEGQAGYTHGGSGGSGSSGSHGCRGLGSGAHCTESNPGRGH